MSASMLAFPPAIRFPVGMVVGAKRWPWWGSHPDCWGRPWRGVVIAYDDPRVWTGTLAFPHRAPTQTEATSHVERCRAAYVPSDRVAVLWDFGTETRAYFESADSLRPYDADVAEWEADLGVARQRYALSRAREVAHA